MADQEQGTVGGFTLHFGRFSFDQTHLVLRLAGVLFELPAPQLALLKLLVDNRHRAVSKKEIRTVVWEGRAVGDSAVAHIVSSLRRSLVEADSNLGTAIESVRGHGYRFAAPVFERFAAEPTASVAAQALPRPTVWRSLGTLGIERLGKFRLMAMIALLVLTAGIAVYRLKVHADEASLGSIHGGLRRALTGVGGVPTRGNKPGPHASGSWNLWATMPYVNAVGLLDSDFGDVTETVRVGWGPKAVECNSSGDRCYVVNCGSFCSLEGGAYDNAVSVIDSAGREELAVVPVGEDPTDIAIDETHDRAFVTNHEDNTVSVIDLRTNRVIETVPVQYRPMSIVAARDGSAVYVGSGESDVVIEVNPVTCSVTRRFEINDSDHGAESHNVLILHPDGSRLYVSNADASISVIDTASGRSIDRIPVGERFHALAMQRDGAYLFVAASSANTVTKIRTSDNTVVGRVRVTPDPRAIEIHPETTTLYVASSANRRLNVIDGSSLDLVATFKTPQLSNLAIVRAAP